MDIVSGLTAAAGLANMGVNAWNTYQEWKNTEYVKEQNQITRDREDTAVQRRIDDLRKAGLSPTLAAGSAAQAGNVVKPEAPQVKVSPAQAAAQALSLMQMKADISKTNAEALVKQTEAEYVKSTMQPRISQEFSQAEYEKLRIEATRLGITNQEIQNEIKRQEAFHAPEYYYNRTSKLEMERDAVYQLVSQRLYDLEKSKDYGVRTTDHDKILTYTMGGLDLLKDAKSGIQNLFRGE